MVVTLGKSGGKAVVSRIRSASSRLAVMLISTIAVRLNSTDGIVAKVTVNVEFSPSSSTVGCPDMMAGTVNEDNNKEGSMSSIIEVL